MPIHHLMGSRQMWVRVPTDVGEDPETDVSRDPGTDVRETQRQM